MDRPCLMKQIETLVPRVEKSEWRDQTMRELAKTYTYEGQLDKALALLPKIEDSDTKAMTVRGIGMAAAGAKMDRTRRNWLWDRLAEEAFTINHAPSRGIAFTYISMSQAFAGDDDAARSTAAAMENGALRNKAYGEAGEIQADRGDLQQALKSLSAIDSSAYRNKEYDIISRIFLDKAMVDEAYACASAIDNAYLKAKSIQRILNKGNAEEEDLEPKIDVTKEF
jgi:predicted negative regulator of RcsB-dependent stress response